MNLPNIPSDNLYKFIALASLILIAVSLYFFESLEQDLDIGIIELTSDQKLQIVELEKMISLNKELVKKLAVFSDEVELDSLRKVLSEENYQILLDEMKKSKVISKTTKDNIATITKELPPQSSDKIFGRELSEIKQLEENQKVNQIRLDKKTNILNEKIKQKDHLKSLFNLTIYPLLILMLIGFYLWYHKVQKYQDIIIKSQATQLKERKD